MPRFAMADEDGDYTDEASEAVELPKNNDQGEVVASKGRPGRLAHDSNMYII